MRDVIASLDEPMRRRGFERRNADLGEATADDRWIASWLRDEPRSAAIDTRIGPVGSYDGVAAWSDGYLLVGMQGNRFLAKVEWRNSSLESDEIASVIAGMVDQYDRFVPNTGPPLERGGWTRG
ncbi:MAG: hypothetical protein ACRCYU_04140 [Nocardioides sp.]